MSESAFISFARDRGLTLLKIITGEPGDLYRQGLLLADGTDYDDGPLFHPFRIYPLYKILETQSSEIDEAVRQWNEIVDLGILIEPVYWPAITGQARFGPGMREKEYEGRLERYHQKATGLIRSLDPTVWRKIHESLRIDASRMDHNSELYLLLRLAGWDRRKNLKERISGALWIRHLAEVIRRGFEEVSAERWPEEDQSSGRWSDGARKRLYGSERPLDDELRSKPYLAYRYGLFTGSAVRWYVEGATEYYATEELLPEPARIALELVNLKGSIKSGKANVALNLADGLMKDQALRRFSVISFDRDDKNNDRAIRQQVLQDAVVGSIAAHDPDFEFANFTIGELVEVAAQVDESEGYAGMDVRNADWSGITSSRKFEEKYRSASPRRRELKGEKWGRALAAYAREHPTRSDNGRSRPLLQEIWAAQHGWNSNYDYQKENFKFDPVTFKLVSREDRSAKE